MIEHVISSSFSKNDAIAGDVDSTPSGHFREPDTLLVGLFSISVLSCPAITNIWPILIPPTYRQP
jgi:hypothetical protein